MVDVQFDDVPFVMRREASLLRNNPKGKDDPAKAQKHAVVQGIYESLVKKRLGRKNFRGRDGERIDVKALEKGTLGYEDIDGMVSRAFAIATGVGRKQGDIGRGSLATTGTRTQITTTGEALSALRAGAAPATVKRKLKAAGVSQTAIDRVMRLHEARGPGESEQRLEDFEVTLTLRRAPVRSRRPQRGAASEEVAAPRRKTRKNPRPPAASDFIRDAIRNVKAKNGNYLYLVRPAGSYIAGQTRDKTDIAGAEQVADFLKSLRWTEVTDETRAMGAGFGKVRYFRAEVPRGLSAYEAILLWGELSPAERARVSVVKAFHQPKSGPTRYELVSDIAPKKARVLHIAVGHPVDPFTAPTKRASTVYTWFPGRITPVVQSDFSVFPVGVHPMATVKAAEVVKNPRLRRNSTVSTAVAVAEETAVLGPRVVGALTRYGRASYEAVKAFLNSPFGSRVAATITSVAISVLGRKVVESGKLSKGEVRIVQDAIAAETGADIPANVVTAAIAAGVR
jgi:hypothetical protein